MLNFGSKPSQDASLRKIAIWGANLVLCSAPEFGPHPGGSFGGQGGLSFYVGAKGRQWSQISHRKLKISISHVVVILASEPDAMLNKGIVINRIRFFTSYNHQFFGERSFNLRNYFYQSITNLLLISYQSVTNLLKFIYSEKATKFCEIFTLLLSVCTVDKSKVKISQKNFRIYKFYQLFTFFQ